MPMSSAAASISANSSQALSFIASDDDEFVQRAESNNTTPLPSAAEVPSEFLPEPREVRIVGRGSKAILQRRLPEGEKSWIVVLQMVKIFDKRGKEAE